MQTRREFVKASSSGLIGLALPMGALAQTPNALFQFQGLICFAIARPKGSTGLPKTASRVTAMLVREGAHPNRRMIIPSAWCGQAADRDEDITNCAIEVALPAPGPITIVTGKRKLVKGSQQLDPCGGPGQWADVTWIANIETICGQGEIHTDALDKPTTTSMVTGRLIMSGGTFQGGPPSNRPRVNYARQVWDMQPQPKVPYRQCFTDSVVWDTGGPACTIRIIDPSGTTRTIPITVSGAGQILVTNLPVPTARNINPQRSVHFRHYYKLLAKRGSPEAVPVKHSVCGSATAPQLSTNELDILKFSDTQLSKAKLISSAAATPSTTDTAKTTAATKSTAATQTTAAASAAAAFGDPLYCENALFFETV